MIGCGWVPLDGQRTTVCMDQSFIYSFIHQFMTCCLLLLQLYTAAINACMANDGTNFDAAFEIYSTMQRNGVEPDDLLYGHLIALAGRCKKLEVNQQQERVLITGVVVGEHAFCAPVAVTLC